MDNVRMWTQGVPVEEAAYQQIRNIASLPILGGPVAIMPDVHVGKGAAVGAVIPTRAAIIPAAVGVDIGCGMVAVRTTLKASDLPDSLAKLRAQIERDVPVGFNAHRQPLRLDDASSIGDRLQRRTAGLAQRYAALRIMHRVGKYDPARVWCQLGTLGGGNHFIELSLDEEDSVWVMLHSGSRNVGNTIGEVAIATARRIAERERRHLPDRDLAWLSAGTVEFDEYVEGLNWAQDYAALNRDLMLDLVVRALQQFFRRELVVRDVAVNCHHNYASLEEHFGAMLWVTRKGAVSARSGQLGIIPGSMGTKSFIVRGKGNPAAYHSCSHGAGRKMSRSEAKRRFTRADLAEQTAGVECRKDAGVIDELPAAYKDVDAVLSAQRDLVDVVHSLKQVLCVKG
ncbi:MAG TPA: RtcB family protein [Casimicrobiaceae bacterium]|jgi:tRNA-splicing ligase RtcB|nr:RtcB family protein [Casimicrobiaceae bacterium]